ncbi:MAG: nickel-dependent hydrogenase large subunit, partial [Deltaproteobacteria bacterium]|nr:nickel-dependent hydrogenase large subunit [Deltaproteobacteria bacterium]
CAARSLLVAFEALEQTLWRILLDWPRCVGGRADEGALKRFRKRLAELEGGVFADSQWNRLGGARVNSNTKALARTAASLTRDVEELLFGGARGDEVLRSRSSFEAWFRAGSNPTAAVFDWVVSNQLEDFGGVGIQPVNEFDEAYICDRIARDDAWEYCGQPEQHGEVRQTGALASLANTPLVRELHGEHGYGLSTQLAARLLEVPTLLGDIHDQILALAPGEVPALREISTGRALGSVDTARGRLFHWVEVRDGRIARYRTLAPTEWNFHPRGPLAQGLAGAPAKDLTTTRRAVGLLMTAIDPCVGIQLEIAEA